MPKRQPADPGVEACPAVRRKVGRPRALTLDEILDAANAMGLTDISLPALAERLGIGTATLYSYVGGRNELIRLASLKRTRQSGITDTGQPWDVLVRLYASRFFELFSSEPQLVIQYMQGGIGQDLLVDYLESYLTAMERRGIGTSAAYRIYVAVNTTVLGAIVRENYHRHLSANGASLAQVIDRALRDRDPDELSYVRACPDIRDEERTFDFDGVLDRVIRSVAAELGLEVATAAANVARLRPARATGRS
jgi:AcrR family transcriptional regulator